MGRETSPPLKGDHTMYYREFTKAAAAEVVREILDNAEPWLALECVSQFLRNEATYEEIMAVILK